MNADPKPPANNFRPGVAAVIRDGRGRIFIGERRDLPGSWQFAQGGRLPGESAEDGLARELHEELSLRPEDFRVLDRCGPYRYLFPPGRTKDGFHGQEHLYFLIELLAPVERVNVHTPDPEFCAVRWIEPGEFRLDWLAPMKQENYRRVFREFFGLEIA